MYTRLFSISSLIPAAKSGPGVCVCVNFSTRITAKIGIYRQPGEWGGGLEGIITGVFRHNGRCVLRHTWVPLRDKQMSLAEVVWGLYLGGKERICFFGGVSQRLRSLSPVLYHRGGREALQRSNGTAIGTTLLPVGWR